MERMTDGKEGQQEWGTFSCQYELRHSQRVRKNFEALRRECAFCAGGQMAARPASLGRQDQASVLADMARLSRPRRAHLAGSARICRERTVEALISGFLIRHSAVAALASGIGGTFLNPTLPSAN